MEPRPAPAADQECIVSPHPQWRHALVEAIALQAAGGTSAYRWNYNHFLTTGRIVLTMVVLQSLVFRGHLSEPAGSKQMHCMQQRQLPKLVR